MGPFSLTNRTLLEFKGLQYKVWALDEKNSEIQLQRVRDGEIVSIPASKLVGDKSLKVISGYNECERELTGTDIQAAPEEIDESVSIKEKIIYPLVLLQKAQQGDTRSRICLYEKYGQVIDMEESLPKKKQLLDIISQESGISVRTLQRYEKKYKEQGKTGLIRKARRSMNKEQLTVKVLHPKTGEILSEIPVRAKSQKVIEIIQQVIQNEYLKPLKISKAKAIDMINKRLKKNRLSDIEQRTLYNIFSKIDEQIETRYREGYQVWKNKFELVKTGYTNNEAMYPLHIVQVDDATLDIIVVDSEGNVIKRPILTIGIDLYSRLVWGFDLSINNPSSSKVKRMLAHGIMPKFYKGDNTENDYSQPSK